MNAIPGDRVVTDIVWLCLCISPPNENGDADEETFAFSSQERAAAFCAADEGRSHVVYSRVIDHPELADMVVQ
jgi:hypothetical protein